MNGLAQYEHGVEPVLFDPKPEVVPDAEELVRQANEHIKAKRWAEAEALLQQACDAEPNNERLLSLAVCQHRQRKLSEALETAFHSNGPDAILMQAAIHEERDSWDIAESFVVAGLRRWPNHHGLLFCRGMQRLRKGDVGGWADYEHRPPRLKLLERVDEVPEWKGQAAPTRTAPEFVMSLDDAGSICVKEQASGAPILAILGQQGIGDQIMFSRWIPEAQNRWGGKVVIYAHTALCRLFAATFPGCDVIASDAEAPENVDAWISIDSLPFVLESYHAPAINLAAGVKPLESVQFEGEAFRVGLSWKGNPEHGRDWLRSMAFKDFVKLLPQDPRIEYHSLQVIGGEQDYPFAIDNTHLLFDVADTAAYMAQMDLVITVDTATAHLAGVMGKPTILLTGKCQDWRWSYAHWYGNIYFRLESSDLANQQSTRNTIIVAAKAHFAFSERKYEQSSAIATPEIRTVDTKRGPFQIFSSDRWISRSIALYGEWSRGEGDLFEAFIKPGDVVVEAGVNIGWHMLHFAQLAGPMGMVIGFEPNPAALQMAIQNVFGNDRCPGESVIYAAALSNESTAESGFYFDHAHPAGAHLEKTGEECKGEPIAVPLTKLDDYKLDKVDFIKADVEGHELAVLQGAEDTIGRCRPLIYVENDRPDNSNALMEWLHEHGYRMYRHFPLLYPGKDCGPNVFGSIVSGMLLAIPREKYLTLPPSLGLVRLRAERERAA